MKFDLKKYLARLRRYGVAGAVGGAMALSGGSAFGVIAERSGQLINVNLDGRNDFQGDFSGGTPGVTEAGVAWVDDTLGDDSWNLLEAADRVDEIVPAGSFENLLDSTGTPTGVNVSWNAFTRTYRNYASGRFGYPETTGPNNGGWVMHYKGHDLNFEFSNLAEGAYDVSLIGVLGRIEGVVDGVQKIIPREAHHDGTEWVDHEWGWNEESFVNGGANTAPFFQLDLYEIWEDVVVGPEGTLTVTMIDGGAIHPGWAQMGGIQLTAVTVIPEPSTFVLLVLGVGLAGWWRLSSRRRD
jgi:hypothetical protein